MSEYTVKDHFLYKDGKPVPVRASPNIGAKLKPSLLILHYTGGLSASSAINTLCDPKASVSAHLVADVDGTITQLVPFNRVAWHAGASAYGKRNGCNSFSIGIEQVNPGLLLKRADGKFVTQLEKKVIPATQVVHAPHPVTRHDGYWMMYPEAQVAEVIAASRAIAQAYGIKDVAGHEDVCTPPGRKIDPGPAYPKTRVIGAILGRK